jgi:hypothetical protein
MPVDVVKLTEAYRIGGLHNWFDKNAGPLYIKIESAIKKNIGDMVVQSAMVDAYESVMQSNLSDGFAHHLKTNHPEIIVDEVVKIPSTARIMLDACTDPNNVFRHYNPQILRFPMQIIFMTDDKEMLIGAISDFKRRHPNCEHTIVGEYGYIEYIPEDMLDTLDDIPDENWEIRKVKGKDKSDEIQPK